MICHLRVERTIQRTIKIFLLKDVVVQPPHMGLCSLITNNNSQTTAAVLPKSTSLSDLSTLHLHS